jgi:hypothetical protein
VTIQIDRIRQYAAERARGRDAGAWDGIKPVSVHRCRPCLAAIASVGHCTLSAAASPRIAIDHHQFEWLVNELSTAIAARVVPDKDPDPNFQERVIQACPSQADGFDTITASTRFLITDIKRRISIIIARFRDASSTGNLQRTISALLWKWSKRDRLRRTTSNSQLNWT